MSSVHFSKLCTITVTVTFLYTSFSLTQSCRLYFFESERTSTKNCISNQTNGTAPRGRSGFGTAQSAQGGWEVVALFHVLQDCMVFVKQPSPAVSCCHPDFTDKTIPPNSPAYNLRAPECPFPSDHFSLGINDGAVLLCASRTVFWYFLCQRKALTLVKCFKFDPWKDDFFCLFP